LSAVFVGADRKQPVSPCGGCRQKLAEFGASDTKVTLANLDGVRVTMTMAELLPGRLAPITWTQTTKTATDTKGDSHGCTGHYRAVAQRRRPQP